MVCGARYAFLRSAAADHHRGLPQISGSSQYEKSLFFKRHFDSVRKLLLAEPRGHREMTGAIVTAPTTEEASFGLLFLNQAGLSAISGHGIIAAVAAWTSTGQLSPSEAAKGILIDCPAGTVKAFADCNGHEVRSVSFWNVPSFVYAEQLAVKVQGMEARVDVAFGGEFYAVVDTSMWETGDVFALPKLREWGRLIREEIERQLEVRHPQLDWITGIHGVFFIKGTMQRAMTDTRTGSHIAVRLHWPESSLIGRPEGPPPAPTWRFCMPAVRWSPGSRLYMKASLAPKS